MIRRESDTSEVGSCYLRHPGVQRVEHEGKDVLVVPFSGFAELSGVAAFVWDRLAAPIREAELLLELQDSPFAEQMTAGDLAEHLTFLLGKHMIVVLPEDSEGPGGEQIGTWSPVAEEVIIPSLLAVRVFAHELRSKGETIRCWSLVSDGLLAVGQKEIVFTVKRESGESETDYPRQLLMLYALFHYAASVGQTVDVGGVSLIPSGTGFLNRADFHGIMYLPPLYNEINIPTKFLSAVILTDKEFEVASGYGVVRMMALLGAEYRFFPCAPWADRQRPCLATVADMEDGILSRLPAVRIPGAFAYLRADVEPVFPGPDGGVRDSVATLGEQRVILELPAGAEGQFAEVFASLPDGSPLAILSTPDPLAEALFCWTPTSDSPSPVISPNSAHPQRVGLNFVALVPNSPENVFGRAEDGAIVQLTASSWENAFRTLGKGRGSAYVPTVDGLGFEIVWRA